MRTLGVPALVIAALAGAANAQFGRGSSVTGELRGSGSGSFIVELYDQANQHVVERVQTSLGESFAFHDVRNGDYLLRVTDRTGNVVTQEFVRVGEFANVISLKVPDGAAQTERPATGTVSVAQLQRKVPKDARKQFEKGMKAAVTGGHEEVIRHLKQAIEIYPDFMEAHNNLAARYLYLGRMEEAIPHLERAVELDAGGAAAFSNLAIAYMHVGRLQDAERAARQSVRLTPGASKSRFVLGMVLAALNQSDEAPRYLTGVAEEFPRARLALANIAARQGRTAEAASELKLYLAHDKVESREEVQLWLARIETAAAGGK